MASQVQSPQLQGTRTEAFSFKGLELAGVLTSYNDKVAIRLANHEYLKRDGGVVEPMGAAQARFSMKILFIGGDATQRYRQLFNAVRQEPRGVLIHPRLGRINVGCEGFEGSEDVEKAIDHIEVTISFIEDAVDQLVEIDNTPGPQQRAGQVTQANAALTASTTARFSDARSPIMLSVVSQAAIYTSASQAFVNSAISAAQGQGPDLSLLPLLGNVLAQQNALLTALDATTAYTLENTIRLTPYRVQTRAVYAGCLQLYSAVIATKPPVVSWTVPTSMPLGVICVQLYGADAAAKQPTLRLLNRIANPFWVQGGTSLLIEAPSIRQ